MAWLGRILRRLTGFCLGGSALLLLVFGLLFVRLIAGPIEVPLREQLLDRAVAGLAPGWKVEASGADLDLFDRDGLSGLRLRDVTVLDAGGEEVARAPLLALKLTWDSSGTDSIALREVAVSGMTVLVTRRADGGFHLGLGDAEGGAIGVSQLLAGKPEGNTASAVPRLRIRDAKLRYRDIARDLDLTAENATLVLDPRSEGLHLTLDAGFRRADLEPMFVQVDVLESAVDKGFSGNISFDGLMPAELAPLDPVLAPLDAVRATLSGAFRFALNAEGVPATVSGSFSGAPGGEIVLAGEPRRFTRLATGVEYDAASGELLLERLELAAEDVEIAGNARVEIGEDGPRAAFLDLPTLAYAPEGAARRLNVHDIRANLALEGGGDAVILRSLQASDLALTDEGGTATLASLEAEGDYLREERRLRVTALAGRDLAITAAGEAGSGGASRLGGNAVVDLEQGLVRFSDLLLSEIRARTPDANISAVSMGVGGIYDFGSGVLGLAGGEISGLAASAQNGTGFDARSVALGGRVEMRGGTFETEELVVTDLSVSLPDRFDAPLRASSIGARLSGRGEAEGYRLRAGELRALIDGLPAILKADILLRKDGTASGRLDTELGPVSAAEVPGFWPKRVAPGALRWVRKNVRSGAIPAVTIEAIFDTADPASDAMNLNFSFHDAVVGIAGDLPPIVAARGVARATLHEFNLSLETGQVEVPGNGHFTLQNSTFAIRDFKPRIPVGHLDLDVDGPVRPILAFLDTQPLGFISKSGFDISTASARARGRVQVSLPLALDMRLEDVEYGARAELHDFRFDEPHTALPISGDVLRITVQEEGLEFTGDARIDGLSARLSYSQRFAAPKEGEPESRLTVSSFLTPEDFARRGVDVTGYLDGVAAIDATADLYPGGGGRIRVHADLTGAALDIATLGWSKPDGVPVTISAEGFRNPDGAGKVERFVVAGAASAEGSVVYDGSGAVGADVRQLRLGEKFDGAVRYNRAANGNSRVELEGMLADLRTAFARAVDSSSGSRPAPQRRDGPVTEIAVKLDRALLRDDLALQRVSGGLRLNGESIAAAKVVGHANGVAPFELLAERRADGLALRVSSEDAGAFLGAASVFSGAYGGTLRVDARTRDSVLPAEVAGTVLINDIEVRDSATMRSILSGGAIGSLVHQMTSGGLRFNKVSLPFAGVGGRWQIDNGVAYGPALGLTLTGGYDIARKGIDLRGTVSPAYAINGALGSVPLLGALLTGGEGEGVFGVTFSVGGTTDSPNVWVNPLSAIAPGFLRKIVSGVMDGQQATPETRRRLEERLRARTPD